MGGAPDSTSASLGYNQQVKPINCIPDDYILDALDVNDTAFSLYIASFMVQTMQEQQTWPSISLRCNQQVQPINCIPDDYILDVLDIYRPQGKVLFSAGVCLSMGGVVLPTRRVTST